MSEQNDNGAPPEGTPEANTDNPLHEDFLSNLPEGVDRNVAEQLVPHWDKYVQNKFQEHARYKPLADVSDEEISDFLDYRNRVTAGDTPEEQAQNAKAWWDEYGQFLKEQYPDLFEEGGEFREREGSEYYGGEDNPYIKQMEQRVEALEREREEERQRVRQIEAADFVQTEFEKIKPDFGNEITNDDWEIIKDDIAALASRYDPRDNDIIQKGYKDYQRIVNNTETNVFTKKLAHPKPAERGGTTEAHTGPPLDYDSAGDAAKARIREAMKHG